MVVCLIGKGAATRSTGTMPTASRRLSHGTPKSIIDSLERSANSLGFQIFGELYAAAPGTAAVRQSHSARLLLLSYDLPLVAELFMNLLATKPLDLLLKEAQESGS